MADVAAALKDWSSTSNSNSPSGSTNIGTGLDDNLREIQGAIVRGLSHKGADIASATTTDLGAVEGLAHDITGTTTITGFGTVRAGIWKVIKFEGALTLTHNSTSLILPGGVNIKTADGDVAIMISEGSGNWRCVSYQFGASAIVDTLSGDVDLTNTGTFFTGPTVAQGTSGTWFASGQVTLLDTSSAARFVAKLWDGTTVIASAVDDSATTNGAVTIKLSGYISAPAGNIRISVIDATSTNGKIKADLSGAAKDSTLTAIRIG